MQTLSISDLEEQPYNEEEENDNDDCLPSLADMYGAELPDLSAYIEPTTIKKVRNIVTKFRKSPCMVMHIAQASISWTTAATEHQPGASTATQPCCRTLTVPAEERTCQTRQ